MLKRGLGALILALSFVAPGAADAAAKKPVVRYEGRLQDENGRPIGGVYPLTFGLYRSAKGGRAVWTEEYYVAVDSGRYIVELGAKSPLPKGLDLQKAFLGVAITGGGEILREKINPQAIRDDGEEPSAAPAAATSAAAAAPASRQVVDYAETAGMAYEADHSKGTDKIGDLTADEILEKLNKSGGKTTIGTNKKNSDMTGGSGGVRYELKCPKNHVVVGIQGGAGIYIDSIQLICAPLE